jgi:hypothetical protein
MIINAKRLLRWPLKVPDKKLCKKLFRDRLSAPRVQIGYRFLKGERFLELGGLSSSFLKQK